MDGGAITTINLCEPVKEVRVFDHGDEFITVTFKCRHNDITLYLDYGGKEQLREALNNVISE